MDSPANTLQLFINGKKVKYENPDPEWTLLFFLRYKLGLCGSKEGCGEGGCGACTVLVSRWNSKTTKIINCAVNACLTPVASLHGCAVVTVDGIGSIRRGVHPVQERIAKSHGTQCGFCTPGFVMSMYALLRNNSKPTQDELEEALQGNLCRCTGYRPILSGFKTFCCKEEGSTNGCCMDKQIKSELRECGKSEIQLATTLYDPLEFKPYHPSQDVLFPPELMIDSALDSEKLIFRNSTLVFYRPVSWKKLLQLKHEFPDGKIIGGNTELGLEAKFKGQLPPVYIQPSPTIEELTIIREVEDGVFIGGGVTLNSLKEYCRKKANETSTQVGTVLSTLAHVIHTFGGLQIRNVATIAGNIVTASPISDLNPILMAAGTKVTFESIHDSRTVSMDGGFFKSYRQTDIKQNEILKSIYIPFTKKNEFLWGEKQCRRRDDDIAIVNTGMRITFDETQPTLIQNAFIVFGGLAPMTSLAKRASEYLVGRHWSSGIMEEIGSYLLQDFTLGIDVPGGMPAYRMSLAYSFFYKFHLHVTRWLIEQGKGSMTFDPKTASALLPCSRLETKESQLYQIVPDTQPAHDLIGRPLAHISALKHATGEAIYVDDMPFLKNEHFGALVLNRTVARGKIQVIDPSEALQLPGVLAFLDSSSFPPQGKNLFGEMVVDEEVFASKEVNWIGQSLGIIIAKDQATAEKALKLVKVKIEPQGTPILTIEDAITEKSYLDERKMTKGNVEEAFEQSAHVLEGQLRIGGQEQFYLETQSCLAVPKEDDELEIFLTTQGPVQMQREIATCLGLAQNRVTVKTRRTGGSFGGKETRCALLGIPAALAAHKLDVPVRMTLNRYDDMEITGHRNPYLFRYKVGFNSNGIIQGLKVRFYTNVGWAHDMSLAILEVTLFALDGAHRVPNWDIRGRSCKTNLPPNTAMRGFGMPEGSLFFHTVFERIANAVGRDSLEIRKLHFYENGDLTHTNQLLSNVSVKQCLEECLQNSEYEKLKKYVAEFNAQNLWKKRGIGVTTTKHNCGFNVNFLNQAGALVMIHLDGSVSLNHGGMEMGQGLHTKMIQIASRVLEIPGSRIYFSETATDKIPNTTATCGSMSTDLNGMAIKNACEILKSRIEPFKNLNPEGKWEDWISAAYFAQTNLSAVGFYKGEDVNYSFEKNEGRICAYNSYGAAVSQVEIDLLTGDHSVLSTWIVMDVGESLNPAVDVGQIEGAFIQGYGLFVLEELLHSPRGQLITRGPSAYKIPGLNDIPTQFHVALLRGSPNESAIYSSRAIGEPPLTLSTSVFFAIRNAIVAARKDKNLSLDFTLDSPATVERIRLACQNEFSVDLPPQKNGLKINSTPWAINA